MALKIIGAGFGRTGTYSLKLALERLGFEPCHHMAEVIGNPEQVALWTEVVNGRPDFGAIFAEFGAAVDFPAAAYWREIHEAFPEAKVVLSARDPERWYESFSQTILPVVTDRSAWPDHAKPWFEMVEAVVVGKALGGRTDRDGILAAYRENVEAVRRLEKEGRALSFAASEGWAPLCGYLGAEVPAEPYPRTNAREEFFSALKAGLEAEA
ncbi:sulfotransferase [Defluviimonas sp. D31]|uniref:sulfotransferase family protein n=1 Tax=Defluviimonas sp. D31 TaxID=3083253 RepID=UPI00296FE71E|nr:sulfotransferase [Defluviimonas sp. D31]MDW4550922.1 sulfotransferase [Defluviimonas sp. D31]